MRVLFDECVPRPFRKYLPEFDVTTVSEKGWNGIENGELLTLAAEEFDVLFTVDKNMSYQQSLADKHIALVQLPDEHSGGTACDLGRYQ